MKLRTAIIAAALTLFAVPALAGQCPGDVKKIDAAVAAGTGLTSELLAQVMALRDKGKALHGSGKHGQSVKTLAKAKTILGIM